MPFFKSSLFVRDHALDRCLVGNIGNGTLTEASLTLGGFLVQNVALVRMCALDLAGLGEIESLLRAGMALQFGHDIFSFLS